MLDLSRLHADIKSLKQFCIRVNKQPYIGDGTKNTFKAEWTDRKNWLTFTQASEAVKRGAKVYHAGAMVAVTGIGLLVGRTEKGFRLWVEISTLAEILRTV